MCSTARISLDKGLIETHYDSNGQPVLFKTTCTTYIAAQVKISETSERLETLMGFRMFVTSTASYDRIACTDTHANVGTSNDNFCQLIFRADL